jgi:MFS family permease
VALPQIGWLVGAYGITWGVSQFFTGRLSDRIGRLRPIVWGMWLCGAGVAVMPLLASTSGLALAGVASGFGMALLYPNLSAAVADLAHPDWRGSAIGIYRFWRDFGYAVGALLLGLAAATTGALEITFWLVGGAMLASGLLVRLLAEETLPRLNPADLSAT